MANFFEVLGSIQDAFTLDAEEQIRVASYVNAGYRLLSAGIVSWIVDRKIGVETVVKQLPIPSLQIMPDDSFLYKELLWDLEQLVLILQDSGADVRNLNKILYLYIINPNVSFPKIEKLLFERVAVTSVTE